MMPVKMPIDVIFDIICPWCYIGKKRLERTLDARPDIEADIRWRPFLLSPEIPPDGIDRTLYLANKYGGEARIRRVQGAIANAGQSVAIDFNFERIRHTPNSLDAHRLIRFAALEGKAAETVESLYSGYFIDGLNIGAHNVLGDIAASVGLDRDDIQARLAGDSETAAIYDENARAHRLGVNGVPSFVFGASMVISGAQDPKVLAKLIDAAAKAA